MSLLSVSHLSVGYRGGDIVQDVSFSLEGGSLCALLGANGAGKTTLLKGICGLAPHRGERKIGGQNLEGLGQRALAGYISYIPQRSALSIAITALDVVLMGFTAQLPLFGAPGKTMKADALAALEQVGMGEFAQKSFLQLSEGQRQLCVLARALVQHTPLMLFDEPDSALDFSNKHRVLSLVRDSVGREKGGLISLHDANLALAYCTHALLLKEGRSLGVLDLRTTQSDQLAEAFSQLYGPVEILTHGERRFMVEAARISE